MDESVFIIVAVVIALGLGKPCRLAVNEHGRQLGKIVIEITIEDTATRKGD